MMRIAVIDDEPLARSGILARLAAFRDVEVVAEFGDGPSALSGITETRPELVFIDIEMPGMSGLDVLAALPQDKSPMAILLTAYDSFALRAFELNVIDYLLKPIDDDRFHEALDRARLALPYRLLQTNAAKDAAAAIETQEYLATFTVRIGSRVLFVPVADVEWISADGDYATLHVGTKQYVVREPLQRIAQRLDPAQFVRVHRSTIVRIELVSELRSLANRDALLRLRDGTPLRASRTYVDDMRQVLQQVRGCAIT
ncbi:MAG TPA: LytTR family DNA-binding domain-containing protein [Burkholderiaceae bacterium]|jgi:two-component system LytT family response regulator